MAHLFTPAAGMRDPLVFRISCTIDTQVDPALLQTAVDQALRYLPYFRSVIRKGLFWYYLEESDLACTVHPENRPPCSPIYRRGKQGLLFDVSYFENRIHLEAFHSLTDGAGGVDFLKTIVLFYFHARNGGPEPNLDFLPAGIDAGTDNIQKYYEKSSGGVGTKLAPAHHIHGEQYPESRLGIIEGLMPVKPLLALAKSAGATLTEYLTALLIHSILRTMTQREKRRPVVITVPADMRKFYPLDKSSRNFFSIVNISYLSNGSDGLEEILQHVKEEFSEKLQKEALIERMNQMSSLEHHFALRAVPLFLKTPILKVINIQSKSTVTASLSNLGVISFPPEVQQHVKDISIISSTREFHVCINSCSDVFAINFASHYRKNNVQRHFFQTLAAQGLDIIISENSRESEARL